MAEPIPPAIEELNKVLLSKYGSLEDGQAFFRVVWSEDQFEHRLGTYPKFDANGNYIGESQTPEFQYVPKYRQWIPRQWTLERLVPVPEMQLHELTTKVSYEPLCGYRHDKDGRPHIPSQDLVILQCEAILFAAAHKTGVKYKDPAILEADPKIGHEVQEARIKALQDELFGNETSTGDALAYKEGVGYTKPIIDKDTIV